MWRDKPVSFDLPALLRGRSRPDSNFPAKPLSRPRIVLVALTVDQSDRQLLTDLGSENSWEIHLARDLREADSLVNQLKAPVALCDREVPEMDWRTAVRTLASSSHEPCVIVGARRVDGYFWEEVIRNRGYDVLARPLREYEVTRIVGLALSFWNSRAKNYGTFRR